MKSNNRKLRPFVPGKRRKISPNKAAHIGEDPDKFHPFRVILTVKKSALDIYEGKAVYYVRAPLAAPDMACAVADQLWQKWEKHDLGLGNVPYPDTEGVAEAHVIDEDDFAAAWKDVVKYGLKARVAGDVSDPMAFTCIGRTDI
jgi:hypothetical protein